LEDITKMDLIFLGLLYIFQVLTLWLYNYIAIYFGTSIAEFLTGVSQWPGIADLLTNYGTTYTFIIGIFCLISGIGLIKERAWAWGSAMVVLTFIIAQTAISTIGSILTYNWFNANTFINITILLIAIMGIILEKPWKSENKIEKRIKVASISYEKINIEKLSKVIKIKKNDLVDRITEMICENIISGRITHPYIYFDCETNKRRLSKSSTPKKKKKKSKNKKTQINKKNSPNKEEKK